MTTSQISTEDIISRESQSLMATYARLPIVLVDGHGCRVTDADGREYLDLVAGIATCSLGHRHPKLVEALKAAADGLWHVSNLYHTLPHLQLAEELCQAAGMERAFFCNSGAEANEAALKLARKVGGDGRRGIVAAEQSFHGRTTGALAATGQPKYRTAFEPLLPSVGFVPYADIQALRSAVTSETAAVVLEVIQGEGGVRPAPDGYIEAAREICDQTGALLVLDEVQTGMGRTGKLFAFQHTGALPDIVCCAKALAGGLPMGCILTRGRAATGFEPGDHASTFGGGPLVASVARTMLAELQAPGMMDHVNSIGEIIRTRLSALVPALPGVVEVRGRGLMWGLVLAEAKAGDVVARLRDFSVLAIGAGPNVVRLVPPLIITEAEINEGLDAIEQVVREVAG